MTEDRKVQVVRQIRDAHDRGEQPTPRAVGWAKEEFQELANEPLVRWYSAGETGDILSDLRCDVILDAGLGLLSRADARLLHDIELRVRPESRGAKLRRVLGIGLWDLVKMPVAWLVGYLMGKLWK